MEKQETAQEGQGQVQGQAQLSSLGSYSSTMIISGVVALLIIAVLVGWYFFYIKGGEQITGSGEEVTGLGSELFEEVNNPIEGKVPTVETTINPIEDFYKNPFE